MMKNCLKCVHAKWQRTEKGRLHPSGDGRCEYHYEVKKLPSAFYWPGVAPYPCGGYINRREEHKEHCVYFQEVV